MLELLQYCCFNWKVRLQRWRKTLNYKEKRIFFSVHISKVFSLHRIDESWVVAIRNFLEQNLLKKIPESSNWISKSRESVSLWQCKYFSKFSVIIFYWKATEKLTQFMSQDECHWGQNLYLFSCEIDLENIENAFIHNFGQFCLI